MIRIILTLLIAYELAGCATPAVKTLGEKSSGFTYVPVNPIPVDDVGMCQSDSKMQANLRILKYLPDNTVRMLIQQVDVSGNIAYGVSKANTAKGLYKVTVDYIDADTVSFPLWIYETRKLKTEFIGADKKDLEYVIPFTSYDNNKYVPGSEIYYATRTKPKNVVNEVGDDFVSEYIVPIYVGIGLRAIANVDVIKADANISGLGIIGAEAETQSLKGSLVVQTLGVNGKSIAAAMPIQSELNRTTAQNAIVAVGTIKALLYAEGTTISPRVVGLYLPFPANVALVNSIISQLSKEEILWKHSCTGEHPTKAK